LATRDVISSTEKLLNIIRSHDNVGNDRPKNVSPSPILKEKKTSIKYILPLKKAITVGVDIGHKDLNILKILQISDQQFRLLGFQSYAVDPQIPKNSQKFSLFLKSAMTDFCDASEKPEIWCLMPLEGVEIQYIRIPMVTKKQIANAAFWTFKKEIPFNEKENIFDFEVLGDVSEKGAQKIGALAYCAPIQHVEHLKRLFSRIGFPLTGITVPPFAIQNVVRTRFLAADDECIGSLYIGRNSSRIDIFSSGNLVLTRGVMTGLNSIIEGIIEGTYKTRNEDGSPVSEVSSRITLEQAQKILLSIRPETPPMAKTEPGPRLKAEEIFQMTVPALERLARQVERSFEHYALNLGNNRVSKCYISGLIAPIERMVDYIGEQILLPCETIDHLLRDRIRLSAGNTDLKATANEIPVSFAPALGMALSHNSRTPNLLFTYKSKERESKITSINRGIFIIFIFILAICMGIFIWQGYIADGKKARIATLEKSLQQYNPLLTQDFIVKVTDSTKQKRRLIKEYSRKYQAVAVIEELSRMTPSNIRLFNFTANLGAASTDEKDKGKETSKTVLLEGLVFGDIHTLEASLAAYLLRLETSPLFTKPNIRINKIEVRDGREILRFMAVVTLV